MSAPPKVVVDPARDEASGETHRVTHRGSGRRTFYQVERFKESRPSWDTEEWDRVGAICDSVEEAVEQSRLRHLHVVELRALSREDLSFGRDAPRTPWGKAQYATVYGTGVTSYGTAGHGGFKLDAKRKAEVHPALRAKGGWYEEDGEWAAVAHTFPQLFTTYERKLARERLMDWNPDGYAAATGETVLPGQSLALRQRAFDAENAANWVVVSATMHDDRAFVRVSATLGGKRPGYGEEWNDRDFLVPAAEYDARTNLGFVIDLERHEELLPESPAPSM